MLKIPDSWVPTAANVNKLPLALRRYLHDLHTNTDPAGTLRENVRLRQQNAALRAECVRLATIRCSLEVNPD
jgi:hypothetical protein